MHMTKEKRVDRKHCIKVLRIQIDALIKYEINPSCAIAINARKWTTGWIRGTRGKVSRSHPVNVCHHVGPIERINKNTSPLKLKTQNQCISLHTSIKTDFRYSSILFLNENCQTILSNEYNCVKMLCKTKE